MHLGYSNDLERSREALFALRSDHHRRSLMSPIDRDFLRNIICSGTLETCRTHQDHWLGRKIDVLLIFRSIARDGFVAKLRKFDANFLGGNAVGPIANDCPIAT